MYFLFLELDDSENAALSYLDDALAFWKPIERCIKDEKVRLHPTQARQRLARCYSEELRLRIQSDCERLDHAEAAAAAAQLY